jgi:hypothetical protein
MLRLLACAIAFLALPSPLARAGVIVGELKAAPESRIQFSWGDGQHNLFQEWSVAAYNISGYVYGTNYSWSNADVYNAGHVNPFTVANAEAFAYTQSSRLFTEGDTLFFRGANGFYGAWVTHNVYTGPYNFSSSWPLLDATWYFQSDGTGNFVPEPTSLAAGAALLAWGLTCRRRRAIA